VIVAVIFFFVLMPLTQYMMTSKKKQETASLTRIGQVGEPWHPAAFPVAPSPLPAPRPAPAPPELVPAAARPLEVPTSQPTPKTLAATAAPGKAPVDPEQEAINSPIMVAATPGGGPAPSSPPAGPATRGGSLQAEGAGPPSTMAGLLKPTELPGYRATVMAHPGMTIEQGRIIQCNSVTRMTAGLPGFVRAKVSYDVWSADNTMKLIDRDSFIFGEIAHGLVNGQDRLFVLWHQITTPPPNLVRITLNSPAADEMGEAGLTGDINHHTMQKIGGALLLSGVESVFSGLSGALSNLGRGNGNTQEQGLNLNFSQMGSQGSNLASQLLQSTITIPDTMTINQSAACSIFVSGDLDFSGVYAVTKRTSR
jgi:type IV secretion system protein VirB10